MALAPDEVGDDWSTNPDSVDDDIDDVVVIGIDFGTTYVL